MAQNCRMRLVKISTLFPFSKFPKQLRYGIVIFNQERAHKIVYNTHSVENSYRLNRANLPSLQKKRLQDLATFMYKVKYGLVPSNVAGIFSVKSSK